MKYVIAVIVSIIFVLLITYISNVMANLFNDQEDELGEEVREEQGR